MKDWSIDTPYWFWGFGYIDDNYGTVLEFHVSMN